jgi:predicted esterase
MLVIAYPGHRTCAPGFQPKYITVSEDDPIVSASVVDRRVDSLRRSGLTVEYHKFKGPGHGFGIGTGTNVEGWGDDAARFCKEDVRGR